MFSPRVKKFLFLFILSVYGVLYSSPFSIVSMSENTIVFDFNLPEYEIKDSELEGFKSIISAGAAFTSEEALPALPLFNKIIGVPYDGSIHVTFSDLQMSTIQNIRVIPNRTVELVYNERTRFEQDALPEVNYHLKVNDRFYNTNTQYPLNNIIVNESAFAGDYKIQSFNFYPFQVNSKASTMTVISSARITVNISGSKSRSTNFRNNIHTSYLSELLANYEFSKNWQRPQTKANINHSPKYRNLNQVSEINIIIENEGIYKVSYETLKEQMRIMKDSLDIRFAWDIDRINPKMLELTNKGIPVPIHFVGENDNSFDPGDYFEFWGEHIRGEQSYYHPYTYKNIYKLKLLDNSVGTRMAVENGGLHVTNPAGIIIPDGFEQTVHFEKQVFTDRLGHQVAQGNFNFHKEDVLFWKAITAPDLSITPFELEYPMSVNTRYFNAKVSIWGASYLEHSTQNDHHAIVRINSALINSHRWRGQNEKIFLNSSNMANSYLMHGTNNLFIDMPGDTPMGYLEQIFLDYFEITYWREYKTDTNYLKFNKPSNRPFGLYQFELQNFTEENVSIYKIGSSIFNNITVEPLTDMGLPPFTLKFQDTVNSNGIEYVAVSESMKKTPLLFTPDIPSDLKNPFNQADYLILTNTAFSKAEGTLLLQQVWQSNNVNTKIIDIQDIYDEFNHGIVSPQAIKDFFTYAFHNWSEPRFSHVLLLGDGIFDKRNPADIERFDIVPFHNVWTYKHGATASDNWYACIIGNDPIADFHISRIGVIEESHIMAVAQKTQNYLNNPNYMSKWHSRVTLASGGKVSDTTDIFAQQNERIRAGFIPDFYQVNRIYTAVSTVSPQFTGGTFQLKDRINDGTVFLQFMGHGGGRIWSDYNLLNANDIRTLSNENYPFVSSLACFASAFDTRGLASIGEVFVAEPNKGAIAHIGFSGLGYLVQDEDFGNFLADGFFNKNINTFGEISTFAKTRLYGLYGNTYAGIALTQGCVLIGDPMIGHKRIQKAGKVTIDNDKYLVVTGDTLSIRASFPSDVYNARVYILNENEIAQNIPMDLPAIQGQFIMQYVVPQNFTSGRRDIKIVASGVNGVYVAQSAFGVGNSIFISTNVLPEKPSEVDSLRIYTDLFVNKEISDFFVTLTYFDPVVDDVVDVNFDMSYDSENSYWISSEIPPFEAGKTLSYRFTINWADNSPATVSKNFSFRILAPDLVLVNMVLKEKNGLPGYDVEIHNTGDLRSHSTTLRLLTGIEELNSMPVEPLESMESRWMFISLPETTQNRIVTARVNQNGEDFGEYSIFNNSKSHNLQSYFFNAGINSTDITSQDNNFKLSLPDNLFDKNVWFALSKESFRTPYNQPDVKTLLFSNSDFSPSYKIEVLDQSVLIDSLGTLPENKRMTLSFNYHPTDQDVATQENEDNFAVYRWDAYTSKWIKQGGSYIDKVNNRVVCDVTKTGTYTVLRNYDTTLPQIDVNVEGQEFTVGGFISGNGVLSFLFSDANGIDILEHPIEMFINGQAVDPADFAISIIPGHTNHIPMKYHLSLQRGDYTIIISCTDVNGNHNSRQFSFKVNDRFDLVRVANYPNPVRSKTIDPVNAGRTRFTYTLTDDADRVDLKVYTVSGRLVKTFRNLPTSVGYHEYPRTVYSWDCRDEEGFFLANGMYFYKITAKKGNKEIVRTGKLSILK